MAGRFDLNLFRVFDAVYHDGSLTRAAESLHLSQPAVSHALARLRDRFDDPLFRREGRGVVPTARAHALAGDVRRALALLDAGIRSGSRFDPASSRRRFRIGMRDSTELSLLPGWLPTLLQTAPGVTLDSVRFSRTQMARDLARGQLDLVVDVPLPVDAALRQQPLQEVALCVAMREGHPLAETARRDGAAWRAAWLAADHVTVSSRPTGPSLEEDALQRLGLHRRIRLRCQSYPAASATVAASDLLLVLPRHIAREQATRLPLLLQSPPVALPVLRSHLYWHHANDDDAGHRWLRAQLQAGPGMPRSTTDT